MTKLYRKIITLITNNTFYSKYLKNAQFPKQSKNVLRHNPIKSTKTMKYKHIRENHILEIQFYKCFPALKILHQKPDRDRQKNIGENIIEKGNKFYNNLETCACNTILVPPTTTLFLLVTIPGMLSLIIFYSFGKKTFLWF